MNTQKYKKQLLEERNRLRSLITEMQDNTLFGDTTNHTSERYTSGELSSYDNHPADIGTDVYMQDMQNSLTIHEESRLDKVETALSKIENGTYGICEQCKNNISEERLEILPETNLCDECAKHQPEIPVTSRIYNQNLINNNSTFYHEAVIDLMDMNKIPNNSIDME